MLKLNIAPTERQLCQFGCLAVPCLPILVWLWGGDIRFIAVALFTGAALAMIAWVRPRWLTPVFVSLSLLSFPIGVVVSEILLLLIFFCVFTPIGLLFRVIRRDTMRQCFDWSMTSYFMPCRPERDVAQYYRQF